MIGLLAIIIAIDAILTVLYIAYLNKHLKAHKEELKVVINYTETLEKQNKLLKKYLTIKDTEDLKNGNEKEN